MFDVGAFADAYAMAALVLISFFSFVVGSILRIWPDKVQAYAENVDGSVLLLSPKLHRLLIDFSGIALITMSMVALLAATFLT